MKDKLFHRRHPDFEAFDKIELTQEPRYKTSSLSGDEWRTSIRAKFFFKGVLVHETRFRDMNCAIMLLGAEWVKAQEPVPELLIETEKTKCDQPGCGREAVGRVRLKRLTARNGEYLHPDESGFGCFRQFCERHQERGNASREDSDSNYETVPGRHGTGAN